MSTVPLDLERKIAQRWAARFRRPVLSAREGHEADGQTEQLAAPVQSEPMPRQKHRPRSLSNSVSAGPKPRTFVLVLQLSTDCPQNDRNVSGSDHEPARQYGPESRGKA